MTIKALSMSGMFAVPGLDFCLRSELEKGTVLLGGVAGWTGVKMDI